MGDVFDRVAKKAEKQDVFDRVSPSEPPELVQRMASLAMKARKGMPVPMGGEDEIGVPLSVAGMNTGINVKPIHAATQVGIGAVEVGEFFKGLPGMVLAGLREGKAPPQALIEKLVAEPAKEQFRKAQEAFRQKRYMEAGGQALGALPLVGPPTAALAEQAGTGDIQGAIARAGGQFAAGAGIAKGVGKVSSVASKISVEPFSRAKPKLEAVMHDRALAVKKHIAEVGEAFKGEAQMKMDAATKAADAANPAGIPRQPIQDAIRADLGELVKIPEKIPVSLQKILEGPSLEQATVFRGQGAQGRGTFSPPGATNLSELPLIVQEQIRAKMNLPPIEAQRPIPTGESWTHEQLKQLRTDLGSELFGRNRSSMAPTVRKAGLNAYAKLSNKLQENATAASPQNGVLWADGTGQYRKYMRDFEDSPVKKIVTGENATDITTPLTGKAAEHVKRILARYQEYGYNPTKVGQDALVVSHGRAAINAGKLTKFDRGILAASAVGMILHPGAGVGIAYEAGRFLLPKIEQMRLASQGAKRGAITTNARNEAIRKQLAERRKEK